MKKIALLGLVISGCVEEGVVICIDAQDPDSFDAIEIAVTLARDDPTTGAVCRPATAQFSPRLLEYCVAIGRGKRYTEAVYLRAQGFRRGELIANREIEVEYRVGEQDEFSNVLLDPSCCASEPCDACMPDGQCLQGSCVGVPRTGVFDGLVATDEVPCDSGTD